MIALVFTFVPALLTALVPRAEAGCAAPYTGAALVKDLGSVASALRNMDDSAFSSSGKALEAGLPCLDQTAPPQLYASAYRYIGAVHFLVDNDVPGARRWFRSSLELEPTYQWDAQELDLGNPLRQAWEAERPNAQAEGELVKGKELAIPSGSAMLLDGRNLVEARATLDRPHLLQSAVVNSRHADGTWLLDGNAFPDETLKVPAPVAVVVEDPKGKKPKTDPKAAPKPTEAPAVVKAEPKPKAEPVAKAEPAPKAEPVAKAEPVKSKPEPVAKAEPAKSETKPANSKVASTTSVTGEDGVQHMTVQRTRPKEKTPLIIVGGVGLAAAVGLYAYSWKVEQDFNEATTTDELERLQASNHAFVIASGASLLVGAGIGYWGVVLDGNTVGFSFGGRF